MDLGWAMVHDCTEGGQNISSVCAQPACLRARCSLFARCFVVFAFDLLLLVFVFDFSSWLSISK
jgi:hypothetical protein